MNEPADETFRVNPPSTWAIATGFLLIYLSWGTTYYVTGYAMKQAQMPPALFGGIRLLCAGTILILYQAYRRESLRITRQDFLRLLPVSICLFLMGNLFITIGQKRIESGVAAILIATTPLFIGFLGLFWPQGERLTWRGWIGLVIGFVGVVCTLVPQLRDGLSLEKDYPALLVLASAASWALGSLLSRRLIVRVPHLTSAAYQMLLGGLGQTALGSLVGEWPSLIDNLSNQAIAAFFYLLIVGSLIGFVTFNWLLVHIPAAKVGTYAYVNPVIAVFISWVMNETALHYSLLAGIAIILVGVYLVRGDHQPSKEIELEPD